MTQDVQYGLSSEIPGDNFRLSLRTANSLSGRFLISTILVEDGQVADVYASTPLRAGEEDVITFQGARMRELPVATSLIFFVWRIDADGPEAFLGRGVFPIFNDAGVLLQGRRPVFLKKDAIVAAPNPVDAMFMDTLLTTWKVCSDWRISSNANIGLDDLIISDRLHPCLDGDSRFLIVTLPSFGFPVLFNETKVFRHTVVATRLKPVIEPVAEGVPSAEINWLVTGTPELADSRGMIRVPTSSLARLQRSIMPVTPFDFDAAKEHPAAVKATRLSRKAGVRLPVKPANPPRPSADELRRITEIIQHPHRAFSVDEKSLLLRYAWGITDRKGALVKILTVVDWTDSNEANTALTLLPEWAPIDIEDVLALLGSDFSNCPTEIRKFAVQRLAVGASNEDLKLYLLQLVQALPWDGPEGALVADMPLVKFLVEKASDDEVLGSLLFWYIQAGDSEDQRGFFSRVGHFLWLELGKSAKGIEIRRSIELQCAFRRRLVEIAEEIRTHKSERSDKKTERLRTLLKSSSNSSLSSASVLAERDEVVHVDLTSELLARIPVPLDPRASIVKIDPNMSFCAKSALSPQVLACEVERRTEDGQLIREVKKYMYKQGDDLRQDQLIIQLIHLMDTLFKRYGLDLKLTPYKVLATSSNDGFIEFVQESHALSTVLASHGDNLLDFFRTVRPNVNGFCGVDPAVLDTFARSCAGYCVITYVLGVGDRHLDNLLLTTDGRLFHVDFSYILGRDPKPFPPPMKLCKEMVDGMGGANSVYYKNFVSKCCQAYSILRRHSKLLISLLRLAADANIKDFREQDPEVAILKVQQKLQVEATDAKAEQDFVSLINESTNALFPVVIEKLHKYALYWR